MLESVNPATGKTVWRGEEMTPDEVTRVLAESARVFPEWSATSFETRAAALRGAAARLRERREQLAVQMTEEMGKPVVQGRSEVDKCAWVCEYYADQGAAFLADE